MNADGANGVAIVTGAGSGIGRACAVALGKRRYRVTLAGRRRDALEETAAAVRAAGGDPLVTSVDVRDPSAVDRCFDETVAHFGRLDLLFNNAGVFAPATAIDQVTTADWDDVVAINLSGAFYCLRAAFRTMKAQTPRGGRIINNGSISAHAPRPNSIAYTATKHAMTGLTKSASLDGRAFDIACGQIDIGNAATSMVDTIKRGVTQADGSTKAEPVIDVDMVAETIAYMASLPLEANIQFMTIMPSKMPFVGRG